MESYESLVASGLTPIKPTPIINGRVPPPSAPTMGRALVGTIPSEFQLDADFAENQYGGQIPSYRLMPPAASGQAAVNAAAQSTQIVVQQSSVGSGLLLETLGSKNPNQSILNLQGTAVIGSDAAGNVTINGTGDGLIHGDVIWSGDPGVVAWDEEFDTLGPGASSGIIGSNVFGRYGFALIGTAGTGYTVAGLMTSGAPPNIGYAFWTNSATAKAAAGLVPGWGQWNGNDSTNPYFSWEASLLPLLDYPSWKVSFVFKVDVYPDITSTQAMGTTKKSIYVGLFGGSSPNSYLGSTNSRPNIFIGLRYDTDPTSPSIGDSTFWLEGVQNKPFSTITRNNTQGQTLNTGVAPVAGTWHRVDIVGTAIGKCSVTLDGSSTNTLNVTFTQMAAVGGSASAFIGNGIVYWFYSDSATVIRPVWGNGSKMTPSGITTAGATQLNGLTLPIRSTEYDSGSPRIQMAESGLTPLVFTALNAGATLSGYPGLYPSVWMGNDSEASPTSDSMEMDVDKIRFVWNPGVGGGLATPNPTKDRYF